MFSLWPHMCSHSPCLFLCTNFLLKKTSQIGLTTFYLNHCFKGPVSIYSNNVRYWWIRAWTCKFERHRWDISSKDRKNYLTKPGFDHSLSLIPHFTLFPKSQSFLEMCLRITSVPGQAFQSWCGVATFFVSCINLAPFGWSGIHDWHVETFPLSLELLLVGHPLFCAYETLYQSHSAGIAKFFVFLYHTLDASPNISQW